MTNDRIIANRMAYISSDPQRGDIVVFYSPDHITNGEVVHFVKRVIGLPGDKIKIQDNKLFINGKEVDEPYLTVDTRDNFQDVEVPEGCYFMMGDNRNHSNDSRRWKHTFVPRKDILGKVVLKYSLRLDNLHIKRIESFHDYKYKYGDLINTVT